MKIAQTKVTKACFRVALALALSVMLFLPVAYADSTITLTSPNAQLNGGFGTSVAINEGDPIVVVGAPFETANAQSEAGNAYALDTTTGLITMLTSPSPPTVGRFGYSVSISGTTAVVGAPLQTANALFAAGHAYVFDATDGSLITTLTSPTPQFDGEFGLSVSISGTTVVVGAPNEPASALTTAGHAYLFDATDGSLITTLTSPNAQMNGHFAYSVSISGTTVVVGAPGETANALLAAGNAYVFDATDGSLITTLTSPNAKIYGSFGWSVAICESDPAVVVGAPVENVDGQAVAGHAYVFDASTGSPIATLTSPYAQASGEFGYSVAISSTTVVVGAPFETANGQATAGHAYSFDASTGFLTTTLTSPNAQTNGNFGLSVTDSCPTVVVGAPRETGGGFTRAGHAYIFP